MILAKFGAYRTNRFEVIQILVNFGFSSAAILDCEKLRFLHFRCLEGVKPKLHAKFGENRTNGSGVIQVFFVNFNGGRRPSCFSNFTISGCGPVAGVTMMLCIKFGPDRINSSKVIEICLSHRKCITGTPKLGGGLGGFRGENLKLYFSKPLKALPYTETRLLTYSA